jgi:hypothetical protein
MNTLALRNRQSGGMLHKSRSWNPTQAAAECAKLCMTISTEDSPPTPPRMQQWICLRHNLQETTSDIHTQHEYTWNDHPDSHSRRTRMNMITAAYANYEYDYQAHSTHCLLRVPSTTMAPPICKRTRLHNIQLEKQHTNTSALNHYDQNTNAHPLLVLERRSKADGL